jgi:hypothetical protein
MKKTLSLIVSSIISLASLSATEEEVSTNPFYSKGYMSTELSRERGRIESKHILNASFGHKNLHTYSELGLTLDARIENDKKYIYSVSRNVTIPKIIFGVNILDNEDSHLSVELSSRPLQDIFDSKILFSANALGLHAKYIMDKPEGKLSIIQGFFREYKSKYRVISTTQLSLEEINQTGAYATFSLNIKEPVLEITDDNPCRRKIKTFQSIFGYKGDVFNIPFAYIAGYWINDQYLKAKDSGYVGVKIGEAKAAKDWSVELYATAFKMPYREYGVFSKITYYAKDNLCLTQEQSWMNPFKMTYKIKHLF